ncbi:Hypothetical predicted protein [Drosophila guanche]|uniref:Uncharacterized protein n=1 Tax=Drosophila guanche TaxID=7266 RepID=A0A3B0JW09_DROGU|nr:Hypothetical predicted protein [Drosophila guanche]
MSSYRTLVDHGAQSTHLVGGSDISLAATSSPKTLHRMIKYWRNSSGKIPGLRKSESFADYRRHSSNSCQGVGGVGVTGAGGRSSTPSTRYQRLESCDNVCLLATPTTRERAALSIYFQYPHEQHNSGRQHPQNKRVVEHGSCFTLHYNILVP